MAEGPDLAERAGDIGLFYDALALIEQRCGGRRTLRECDGRMAWPRRGVYFFFEPGEFRTDSGTGLRVVRVGTHALRERSASSLWGRLSQHRGSGSGLGNHRGSIFRLLVGEAILATDGREVPSWGQCSSRSEAAAKMGLAPTELRTAEDPVELEVSQLMGSFEVLWMDVSDNPSPESARGQIEKNSIALLANFGLPAIDAPSTQWLGRYSSRDAVRQSGLWNNNHVRETYDPAFLGLMA